MRLMVIHNDPGASCNVRRDLTIPDDTPDPLAFVQNQLGEDRMVLAVMEAQPFVDYDQERYRESIADGGPPVLLLKR